MAVESRFGWRAAWLAGIAVAAGCGPSEAAFVVDYTDAYCTWYLQCADPAILVFDGLDDVDTCKAVVGPEVAAEGAVCKVSKGAARACLDQLATVPCPEPGTLIEDAVPVACDSAWKKCTAQPGDDATDEPATGSPDPTTPGR